MNVLTQKHAQDLLIAEFLLCAVVFFALEQWLLGGALILLAVLILAGVALAYRLAEALAFVFAVAAPFAVINPFLSRMSAGGRYDSVLVVMVGLCFLIGLVAFLSVSTAQLARRARRAHLEETPASQPGMAD